MTSADSAPPEAPFEPLEVTDGSVIDSQFYVFYSLFGLIHIALLIMYVLQILAAKRIEKERARYEKNLLLQSTFKKKTFSPKTRPRSNSDHVRRGSDLPSLVSQTPHMDGTKTLGPSRKPIQRHSLPDIASGLRSAAEQEEVLLRMPTETKTSSTFTMSATRSNNRDDEKLCRYPTDNFSVTRTATSSQRFYNEFEVDRASTITSPSSIHTSHSNDKISVVTSGSDLDCPPTNATIARMPSAPTLAAAAATYALVHGESEEAIDEEDGWHRDQGGEATPKVFDREHVIDIPAGGAGAGAGTTTHATEESPPSSVDNTPRRATNANTDEVSVTVTVTVTNTNNNTNTATQPTTETTVSLPISADSVAIRMQSDEISPPRMTSFANIGSLETAAAESAHHTSSVLPFTTAMPYGSRLQPMAEDAPENSAAEGSVSRKSRPVNNKGSRQQSLLRYGQDKKTAKAAASKEVSRSKSKSKRVVNFPRVGRVHVAFHWCGILVCAIQLVQLIDYFGINGIYPLWTVRMWSNMTTFAEIAASAYVVYDFIRLRYVSLFATVPKELSLFLGGIVALTAMFIIAGVVARSVSNQQWTFGLYFAWYGVAIISLAATLDYNVFHLTKRINELKAHWDTQAKKTFPQPPEKKVSHSRTPSRSRSRLAPKIATLTISPVPANQADSSADSSPATPDIKKLNVFSPSPKAFREQMAAAAWASNSEPPSPNAGPFSAPVSPLIGSSPVGGSSAGSPRNGRETPEYSFVSEVRESVSKKSPVASQLFSHNGNESRRNSVRGVITESQIRNLQPMANKASLKAQATLREVVKNMTKMAAFFTAFALFFGVFCLYTGCMRFADPYKLQSVNEPERFSSASSDVIGAVAQLSFLLASFWYAFIPLKYLHHNFFLPTSPSDQVAV